MIRIVFTIIFAAGAVITGVLYQKEHKKNKNKEWYSDETLNRASEYRASNIEND